MISKDKDDKLVRIYFYIFDEFKELQLAGSSYSKGILLGSSVDLRDKCII